MVLTPTTRVSRVILAYAGGAPPASFSVPGDMHGGSRASLNPEAGLPSNECLLRVISRHTDKSAP